MESLIGLLVLANNVTFRNYYYCQAEKHPSMIYKKFAIDMAKKAGKIMLANFTMEMKKEWKKDGTPVTKTDVAINKMIISAVKKYFPTHDVLGEEESSLTNKGEYLWVCDPVDGTVPFSHGIPTFVFSLALVYRGAPILGVIYDPIMNRLYFAEKNKGAFLNNVRIRVNKLKLGKGVIGWSNFGMSEMRVKFPKMPIICLWCVCYEGALVASGELNATYYSHNNAHDVAALKIIVEEAGGKVTDKFGKEQRYDRKINGALITNGKTHAELLKFIKDFKK